MIHRGSLRLAASAVVAALVLGAFVAPVTVQAAGPIRVTTVTDSLAVDGACSLREAIRAANLDQQVDACRAGNHADHIIVPAGTYQLAIEGRGEDAALQGDLDVTADLAITGAGRDTTIVDAAGLDRVLDVFAPSTLALRGLTITGGSLLDWNLPRSEGAGIENAGNLVIVDVAVTGNATVGRGGGIHSTGPLAVTNSLVDQNTSYEGSGGIDATGRTILHRMTITGNLGGVQSSRPHREDIGAAGGLGVSGSLWLTRSLIEGNHGWGGEWGVGGAAVRQAWIVDTTIRGNSGTSCGSGGIAMVDSVLMTSTVSSNRGGYCADAGGVIAFDSRIVNSTISGNHLEEPYYGHAGGIFSSGTTIVATTITANIDAHPEWSGQTSGLYADTDVPTRLIGTILAENRDGDGNPADCVGAVESGGNNLIGSASGCPFPATGTDLVGVDPLLGPLADNGGPTMTHSLLAESPAIDAFACGNSDDLPACLASDQRGVRRPQDGNGDHVRRHDIGALEAKRPG
jgi:CSLREA domain-containing protein